MRKLCLVVAGAMVSSIAAPAQVVGGQVSHVVSGQVERKVVITGPGGAQETAEFVSAELAGGSKIVKKAPYSADAVTESVQVLADGNRIVRKNTSQLARDSEGRTYRHEKMGDIGPLTTGNAPEVTFIYDPVAGVNWVLDSTTKTARKMVVFVNEQLGGELPPQHIAYQSVHPGATEDVMFYSATAPAHASTDGQPLQQFSRVQRVTSTKSEGKNESLGKRVIEGVECEGTKSTFTIAAGSMGNERPIEVVSERWFSPELQVVVYSKRSDPRIGETTYSLTGLQRSEPSKLVFEIPSDYKVTDGKMMIGTKKKED